jgi:hypothetical protein
VLVSIPRVCLTTGDQQGVVTAAAVAVATVVAVGEGAVGDEPLVDL